MFHALRFLIQAGERHSARGGLGGENDVPRERRGERARLLVFSMLRRKQR